MKTPAELQDLFQRTIGYRIEALPDSVARFVEAVRADVLGDERLRNFKAIYSASGIGAQIDKLAKFLLANEAAFGLPGDEGAVDMAIRLLRTKVAPAAPTWEEALETKRRHGWSDADPRWREFISRPFPDKLAGLAKRLAREEIGDVQAVAKPAPELFKVGDVVVDTTSGFPMTVQHVCEDGVLRVAYFTPDGEACDGYRPLACVRRATFEDGFKAGERQERLYSRPRIYIGPVSSKQAPAAPESAEAKPAPGCGWMVDRSPGIDSKVAIEEAARAAGKMPQYRDGDVWKGQPKPATAPVTHALEHQADPQAERHAETDRYGDAVITLSAALEEEFGRDRAPAPPPVETYLRATVVRAERECIGGLELREGEDCDGLYVELDRVMSTAQVPADVFRATDLVLARAIQAAIAKRWPDRAYFLEVGPEGHDRYVQVFQPWGVPRKVQP